jgi:DNA-binding response OmpR family regulator
VVRVLVVDDDPIILELLVLNLELEGHDVVTASDGRQALDRAHDADPDLVLLDIMMPEIDGFEVCERLRADPATATLPVVFLSARAHEADLVRGTKVGGDAYVTKPFDPMELMELIARIHGARPRERAREVADGNPAPGRPT